MTVEDIVRCASTHAANFDLSMACSILFTRPPPCIWAHGSSLT